MEEGVTHIGASAEVARCSQVLKGSEVGIEAFASFLVPLIKLEAFISLVNISCEMFVEFQDGHSCCIGKRCRFLRHFGRLCKGRELSDMSRPELISWKR